ncbi:hypothetical protein FH581_023235 (plasmid) [Leptospira weilii]|uniref:hypothetical protein n=1 Tax=Leptospira weilii TaxID=28184 RepID=UPI00201B8840|nr:hypothetical protein [Leptospira weilii]UPY81110.1 hypothetical protein FH581_022920 [Leptospira weilii]UPY81166.1 hypothetical protein FH581_023235 [Leptospira weilii]
MRKSGQGGSTPFSITTKPNVLTPLTNEEMIDRRGESALWYRLTPCPCPQEERVPDCKFCFEGLVRTFQEELEITEEMAYKVEGNKVFTRFAPISEIVSANLISRETHKPLTIKRIEEEYVEVEENLKYWNSVLLRYKVKMVECLFVEGIGENEYVLFPKLPLGAIVGVEEVFFVSGEGVPEAVEFSGFTFNSIVFPKRVTGLFRFKLKFQYPIKVAYKTYRQDSDARKIFDRSQITFQEGELLAVVGGGYRMGEGDLVTLLVSTLRHSEYIQFQTGNYDTLSYSPVSHIDRIFSKGKHGLVTHEKGKDFILFGDSKIKWLTDKPRNGYSLIYDYHPTFRISGFIEGGSGEDRDKPKLFKMKPISNLNTRGIPGE